MLVENIVYGLLIENHRLRLRFLGALNALYLRSVCLPIVAFHVLRCHPLICMLLKVHLIVDSSPT
jgi:hypothetical protein